MYKNIARSRLFCRTAKRSIIYCSDFKDEDLPLVPNFNSETVRCSVTVHLLSDFVSFFVADHGAMTARLCFLVLNCIVEVYLHFKNNY